MLSPPHPLAMTLLPKYRGNNAPFIFELQASGSMFNLFIPVKKKEGMWFTNKLIKKMIWKYFGSVLQQPSPVSVVEYG
jgi:hypothetical protein